MQITQALIDGLTVGFIFNYGIFLLMQLFPRSILYMLPKYFSENANRQPRKEISDFNRHYLPILGFVAVVMVVSGVRVYAGTSPGFWDLFWHGYIVAMFMNLGDAFFLDLWYIHTHRLELGEVWGVDPEKLRAGNFFKHLTLVEHFIFWPLVICPAIGLLFAAVVRFFL